MTEAMKMWTCKVGEAPESKIPRAADGPMRRAVAFAFQSLTGVEPTFVFSGWGDQLDESERAVVENREPDYRKIAWSSFMMTRFFHARFGMMINDKPVVPTEDDRVLRGKLILEETIETLCKGLGLEVYDTDGGEPMAIGKVNQLSVRVAGPYDPVETLDGLADVKVDTNGTAVAFGLPMEAADREVFHSNMSKLDSEGNPIINGYTPGYRAAAWDGKHETPAEPGYRADQPVGKGLKSSNFREPDIEGLLSRYGVNNDA